MNCVAVIDPLNRANGRLGSGGLSFHGLKIFAMTERMCDRNLIPVGGAARRVTAFPA